MDKYIGRLLDNRYEILEEIGRGGMAVVYRARCHRLNRYVAVKILKDELSRDEDFRRRFYAESQAVAMLSHPNIVAVYDVNHSNDIDYIVMELIDGLTLKQYMQQRGALSWREALHFATQIAKALEHAHSRGIIHRDIKPHNIMILKDGSVKVADFGIARLNSAQNTLTREALGSVHYISPEQAKGAQVDARSDLYSLGVVMYEMLTGKPPYDGESPVAIAIQHINATPVPPRQLNPSIPLGLQQITLHAMCSDLSARYASATAMIEDLEALRKNPQVVFRFNAGPGGTTAYVDARQVIGGAAAGAVAGAAAGAAAGAQRTPQQRQGQPQRQGQQAQRPAQQTQRPAQQAQRPAHPADAQQAARQKARTMAEKSVQRANQEKRTYHQSGYSKSDYYEDDEADEPEGKGGKVAIIVVCVLLALVAAAGVIMWKFFLSPADNGMLNVPSFLGQNIEQVLSNELYQDFNLVEGDSVYNSNYDEGQVCDQSIQQGQKVTAGTTIKLTVSKGPQTGEMPNVLGYSTQDVQSIMQDLLTQLSLNVSYSYQESSDVEEGCVIATDPAAGATLNAGDSVTITVSSGQGTVMTEVPDVMELEEQDAVDMLYSRNLEVSVSYVENDADAGLVFYQSIKSGNQVPKGTVVSIKVSLGRAEEPSPSPSEEPSPSPSQKPAPEYTPEPTPEYTPEPTPEYTPEVTEEPTPEYTPEVSPDETTNITPEE